MILPLSIPSLAALVGAGDVPGEGSWGRGAPLGVCFPHIYSQAKRRPPRRRETSGLTVTCAVPLPIPDTPLDLAWDSQAAGRAQRQWGLLCLGQALPSLIRPCPLGDVVSPQLTAETWACVTAAIKEVEVLAPKASCCLPSRTGAGPLSCQLERYSPCPAWGMLLNFSLRAPCHHHLASGTGHPLNKPHHPISLELGD